MFKYSRKYLFFLTIFLLSGVSLVLAMDTFIDADHIEHDRKNSIYYLFGNVTIKRDQAVLNADYVEYYRKSSLVKARNRVSYSDGEIDIKTRAADLYLDDKTGVLTMADITFKADNYHLYGDSVTKISENEFDAEKATFTTCEPLFPAWCFSADKVNVKLGDRIRGKHLKFKLKGLPVIYSPYFYTAIERKTGFLIPSFGYKSDKGAFFNIPFYWAISENRDATFVLDAYTKKGIGKGVEYRYKERNGMEGKWWLYHLYDDRHYFNVKGEHTQFTKSGFSTIFDVDYLSKNDYYKEYSHNVDTVVQRFLQSFGEVSYLTGKTRFYLLSQYWVDLQHDRDFVSQKLPEFGITLHPIDVGPLELSITSSVSSFYSDDGIRGERGDIRMELLHRAGKRVRLTQRAGFRANSYSLSQLGNSGHSGSYDDVISDYKAVVDTTLHKRYSRFTHIFEPSISYRFLSDNNEAPIFDSLEMYKESSEVEVSLMNYLRDKKGTFFYLQISDKYDFENSRRPYGPLTLRAKLYRPLSLKTEAFYNHYDSEIERINTTAFFRLLNVDISLGERYDRRNDIFFLTGGLGFRPLKNLRLETTIWRDIEEKEMTHFGVNAHYTKKCWGVNIVYNKRPDDYNLYLIFELKGVGQYRFKGG